MLAEARDYEKAVIEEEQIATALGTQAEKAEHHLTERPQAGPSRGSLRQVEPQMDEPVSQFIV